MIERLGFFYAKLGIINSVHLAVADSFAQLVNGFSAAAADVKYHVVGLNGNMAQRPVGQLAVTLVHRADHKLAPKARGFFGVFNQLVIFHFGSLPSVF